MYPDLLSLVFVGLFVWDGQAVGYSQDPVVKESIEVLRSVGIPCEGDELSEFLRTRMQNRVEAAKLEELASRLSDPAPEVRWRAAGKLVGHGSKSIPVLRAASRDDITAQIAKHCLSLVEGSAAATLPRAAITVLGEMNSADAVTVLLAYVAHAEDDTVLAAIRNSLEKLASVDGKPNPILEKALESKDSGEQIMAIEILCRPDRPEVWPRVRKLLQADNAMVRKKAAETLLACKDESAIPVLIDLLAELPGAERSQVEALLTEFAGSWRVCGPEGDNPIANKVRRDAWKSWWANMDGETLLQVVRDRTPTPDEEKKLTTWIEQLGSSEPAKRDEAATALVDMGPRAVAVLQAEMSSKDPERIKRAENCLKLIPKSDESAEMINLACRVLAVRKPAGAVDALLAFSPYAPDVNEINLREAMTSIAFRDGKVDPVVVAALEDAAPKRRILAINVLTNVGGKSDLDKVRALIKDAEPTIRARAILALVESGDRQSVPALIELLGEPGEVPFQAEDLLMYLAGDRMPKERLGDKEESRKKCKEAWESWWRDHGETVVVARRQATQYLGYLLVIQMNPAGQGEVVEWDRDGKQRWKIEGLTFPVDAQVLPNRRVLVAEYNSQRVTERDVDGKVHWEKRLPGYPVNAQRLSNGNTFIATQNALLEYDRADKEVLNVKLNNIYSARRFPNGQIACLLNTGVVMILDQAGKEKSRFQTGPITYTSGLEITPKGNVIVALASQRKVVEYDLSGKVVWEKTRISVTNASRTPVNTTMVAAYDQKKLIEIDSAGKEVWTYKEKLTPWRAWRR